MREKNRFLIVLTAAVIITVMALPAMAADQAQVMLQKQEKLMTQIQRDTGMSDAELEGIKLELNNALQAVGTSGPVRSMVRFAYYDSCQGECLGVALNAMARAMSQNYSTKEAQGLIRKEIRNCVRERKETGISAPEMAVRLQTRLEDRILARINQKQELPSTTDSTEESTSASSASENSDTQSNGGTKSSGGGGGKR